MNEQHKKEIDEPLERAWKELAVRSNFQSTQRADLRNGDVLLTLLDNSKLRRILLGITYRDKLLSYDEKGEAEPFSSYDRFIKLGHIDTWQNPASRKVVFEIFGDLYDQFSEEVVYANDWQENDLTIMTMDFPAPFHLLNPKEVQEKINALENNGFSGGGGERIRFF